MKQIGAYEAKTHFGQLLDEVAHGEQVTITRHGAPIAVISPVTAWDREKARDAVKWFKESRKTRPLNGLKIRDLIEEGRRF